jgi:hypothetical protein
VDGIAAGTDLETQQQAAFAPGRQKGRGCGLPNRWSG